MISHAIILAAGLGKRMRPLTDTTPKPLLKVGGKRLIEYHIEGLQRTGVRQLVINTGRMGQQFEESLGDGRRYGVVIRYSHEGDHPLETGGGIVRSLPLLGEQAFIAVNGDIWTDYDFTALMSRSPRSGHLVLVNNPDHNPKGDFAFSQGKIGNEGDPRYTFSGIAVYHKDLFDGHSAAAFSIVPLLRQAIDQQRLTAELYGGEWFDIGTPRRLAELDQRLRSPQAPLVDC